MRNGKKHNLFIVKCNNKRRMHFQFSLNWSVISFADNYSNVFTHCGSISDYSSGNMTQQQQKSQVPVNRNKHPCGSVVENYFISKPGFKCHFVHGQCKIGRLVGWGLTALSAQTDYIVPSV